MRTAALSPRRFTRKTKRLAGGAERHHEEVLP